MDSFSSLSFEQLSVREFAIIFVGLFLVVRILQRLYFLCKGHKHHLRYSPKRDLEKFLHSLHVHQSHHDVICRDHTILKYRIIGKGPYTVYLANGVGTDFFMWLPILKYMVSMQPDLFDRITLIVPSYRGLFGSEHSRKETHVTVTLEHCFEDIPEICKDAKVKDIDLFIGWSTGAQAALCCLSKYPTIAKQLCLLNPSTGKSLHTAFQAIVPMPGFIGRIVSYLLHSLVLFLRPHCFTIVWTVLKAFALSPVFRLLLGISAFLGGFPPEQPLYFHEYMRDAFSSRKHTQALLDLILALDAPCPQEALMLTHPTVIISGYTDIMTGVYHSQKLAKSLPNSKHVSFTMGSHFVLLEWPELVAKEIHAQIFASGSNSKHKSS